MALAENPKERLSCRSKSAHAPSMFIFRLWISHRPLTCYLVDHGFTQLSRGCSLCPKGTYESLTIGHEGGAERGFLASSWALYYYISFRIRSSTMDFPLLFLYCVLISHSLFLPSRSCSISPMGHFTSPLTHWLADIGFQIASPFIDARNRLLTEKLMIEHR